MDDKQKIKILRQALTVLVGADTKEELDKMELTLRSAQCLVEKDKAAALNAIHALQETVE